ncbi:riboflavin synthase subunit alpha, partial [Streptococcus pneumoniae]
GKYVQKLMDNSPKSEISKELLYQNGF